MPNAIITGATKGIGKAIAERLLNENFNIAICARSTAELALCSKDWQQRFPQQKIITSTVDVSNEAAVKSFGREALAAFGHIDVLINNAGVFLPGNVSEEPDGHLQKMIDTNLMSAYHLSRVVIPSMKEKKQGHLFNICSIAALRAYPGGGAYSISKYALLGFTDNLRLELSTHAIKVTAISPGAVWTDSWKESGFEANRMIQAKDIADTVWNCYQLSPQANVDHIILRPLSGDL